ncbi:MAG: hypothetical protein WC781_03215 [Candidatus Pacearchaeota archaeon]|jgi:biotin operon repressor
MFNWFSKKRELNSMHEETKRSFELVKNDIDKVGAWVTHLNNQDITLNTRLDELKGDITSMKDEIEQLKDVMAMYGENVSKQLFKTAKPVYHKQTAVEGVQTAVQTAVQTGNFNGFSNLSVTERAIIWVLANNDLKLSYDDLAAMLGKTRSTIRGQINSIKQKSEGLIEESVELSGKKRVYIPGEMREKILKTVKVRVKPEKKSKK